MQTAFRKDEHRKAHVVLASVVAGIIQLSLSGSIRAGVIDSMPPVVVKTVPESGAKEVAPGEMEIKITFSKEMSEGSWSWFTAWQSSRLEVIGKPKFSEDHKTCVLKVRVQPSQTYAYWLNNQKDGDFKDCRGHRSVPYLLVFQTAAIRSEPSAPVCDGLPR